MTYVEPLRTGSAAMSRMARKNPMELLVSLIEDDPTASDGIIFRKWSEIVRGDDDYLAASLQHAFTNMMKAAERHKRKPQKAKPSPKEVAARVARMSKRIDQIIMMKIMVPGANKPVEECTFAELARAPGWYAKVAKLGKPNQIVGKVLSEEQLRAIKW